MISESVQCRWCETRFSDGGLKLTHEATVHAEQWARAEKWGLKAWLTCKRCGSIASTTHEEENHTCRPQEESEPKQDDTAARLRAEASELVSRAEGLAFAADWLEGKV